MARHHLESKVKQGEKQTKIEFLKFEEVKINVTSSLQLIHSFSV